MRLTKPYHDYGYLMNNDIAFRFYQIYFNQLYDPDLVRDLANAASFYIRNQSAQESLLPLEEVMGTIPPDATDEDIKFYLEEYEYNKNIQDFIRNLDFSLFKGNTPLQIASAIIATLTVNNEFQELSNEQIQSKLRQQEFEKKQKEEEEEENKKSNEEKRQKALEDRKKQEEQEREGNQKKKKNKNAEQHSDGQEASDNEKSDNKEGEKGESENNESDQEEGKEAPNGKKKGKPGLGGDDDSDGHELNFGETDWDFSEEIESGDLVNDVKYTGIDWQDSDIDIEERLKEEEQTLKSPRECMLDMFKDLAATRKYQRDLHENMQRIVKASEGILKHYLNPANDSADVILRKMTAQQKKVLDNLSILASRGKIKAHKENQKVERNKMIRHSEIVKLAQRTKMLLPTFKKDFATKKLITNRHVESSKQILVLMIDDSGSMSNSDKISWVKSIIFNRLEAVSRGDGILYIVTFVQSCALQSTLKISNRKEAIEFIKSGWMPSFNGGGTDIQYSLKQIEACIHARKIGRFTIDEGLKPQIVIMNDGQDTVDGNYKPSIQTHAFILGTHNDGLRKLVSNVNGHYEKFM